jgi:hypothetical protein
MVRVLFPVGYDADTERCVQGENAGLNFFTILMAVSHISFGVVTAAGGIGELFVLDELQPGDE